MHVKMSKLYLAFVL